MIFRASDDKKETGRTDAYPSTRKLSSVREELLQEAGPGGYLCVYLYFMLEYLLTSKAVQATRTSRLSCVGKKKGNS